MNPDEPPMTSQRERLVLSYVVWLWVGPIVLLGLGFVLYFTMHNAVAPTKSSVRGPSQNKEGNLDSVRQGLTRQTHLVACRNALQQINAELGDNPSLRPPSLTSEQKKWLSDNMNFSREELSEVEMSHYTRLDNHHLFRCFLMREAANALEVKGVRGKGGGVVRENPLDQAARAFAWVMREVRLRDGNTVDGPPSYVVRRGTGTALERTLVFADLLEQLGNPESPEPDLLAFLLLIPNGSSSPRMWACGVLAGESNEVYLFDPYLGLPLPGPKGEGIATLAQVCGEADALAQLNLDEKHRYPVTREQARSAQAQLVCPLSAMSPRMRYLQDKLLAPAVRVRLAYDVMQAKQKVEAACSTAVGKPIPVSISKNYSILLRQFLSVDEGGTDTDYREQRFLVAMVPWSAMPVEFLDEKRFPPKIGLGERVRELFAAPFIRPVIDPGQARDLILRGRYSSVVPILVDERAQWRNQREQAVNASNIERRAVQWLDGATAAYAKQITAKTSQEREEAERAIKSLWSVERARPIYVILNAAVAAAREPETVYQLGLCSQEEAEQLQARLDLKAKVGSTAEPREKAKAAAAWRKAFSDWSRFEDDYPDHPDRHAVRQMRGRAASMLGDNRSAIDLWKKVPASATALEKLGSLYLAQQWQKKHPD
jgi:hypothetical protein